MSQDKMMNKLFADVNDNPPEFASKYYLQASGRASLSAPTSSS